MDVREIVRLMSPTRWAIAGVLAVVLFALAYCALTEPARRAARAMTAKAGQITAGHGEAASAAAANATADLYQHKADQDQLTERGNDDIRSAQGHDAPVDPHARDAGLRALCLHDDFKANPHNAALCKAAAAPAAR
jgi:hypothetical protein